MMEGAKQLNDPAKMPPLNAVPDRVALFHLVTLSVGPSSLSSHPQHGAKAAHRHQDNQNNQSRGTPVHCILTPSLSASKTTNLEAALIPFFSSALIPGPHSIQSHDCALPLQSLAAESHK